LLFAALMGSGCESAVAQTTSLATACRKTGIYIGPRNFQTLQDKPFKLSAEGCLDGTAWSSLFNFKIRLKAKLDDIQSTVEEFLNKDYNTCTGRDVAVRVTSLDVDSKPAVKEQQDMILSAAADLLQCSGARVAAQMTVEVPFKLNTQTLRVIYEKPQIEVWAKRSGNRLVRWKDTAVVWLFRDRIRKDIAAQVEPLLEKYKNFLAENRDKIQAFQLVVKTLDIRTQDNAVSANVMLNARMPKRVVEEQTVVWINDLHLK
jgi:hypothetical protein